MYKFLILSLISLQLSCLTWNARKVIKGRSSPETELSVHCPLYAKGEMEPPQSWKENWALPLHFSALILDTGIIYLLSVENGLYGLGYYVFSELLFAGDDIPLQPVAFGSWCGSPDTPLELPAEYFYAAYPDSSYTCVGYKETFQNLLFQASEDSIALGPESIELIRKHEAIEYSVSVLQPKKICLHTLRVLGGKSALDSIIEKQRLNGG